MNSLNIIFIYQKKKRKIIQNKGNNKTKHYILQLMY